MFTFADLSVVVTPDDLLQYFRGLPVDGLLGMDALGCVETLIDYAAQTVRLRRTVGCTTRSAPGYGVGVELGPTTRERSGAPLRVAVIDPDGPAVGRVRLDDRVRTIDGRDAEILWHQGRLQAALGGHAGDRHRLEVACSTCATSREVELEVVDLWPDAHPP